MKLKLLFSAALITFSAAAFAQNPGPWLSDSVVMGAGYANDVFYDIEQGSQKYQSGSDWDIAFQMTKFGDLQFNAAVRANHARRGVEVYSLNLSAAARWSTITAADTIGKTTPDLALINNDTSWGTGAFYQNKSENAFSYGWGVYTPSANHAVIGDSVYLVQTRNASTGSITAAYKFWVEKYTSYPDDSIRYLFHVANLDGTNSRTVTLWRKDASNDFSGRLFAYYDLASGTASTREPVRSAWELLFTRYRMLIPGPGGSGLTPYNLTGVLSNISTEIADVRHLSPDDASFGTSFKMLTRTTHINEIGDDWKTYDFAQNKYVMDDSASFVILNKNTNKFWELHFTRFDGSSTGWVVFAKRFLGYSNVGVAGLASGAVASFTVAPNPATAATMVLVDAKAAAPSARLTVTDMAGHIVMNVSAEVKAGLNAFNLQTASLASGTYAVQVAGADWKVSTRLVVAH